MAKGRGFEFGDAGTDRIVLYAVLGVVGYSLLKLGPGISSALSGAGAGLGAGGNVMQALADAINAGTQAIRDGVSGIRGMNPFSSSPDATLPADFGPTYDQLNPLEQQQLFPDAMGGSVA